MQPRSPRGGAIFAGAPPAMRPFVEILWPLVSYGFTARRGDDRLPGLPWGRNFYPHTHPIPMGIHIPTAESIADLSNARNGGLITPVASLGLSAPGGKSTEVRPTDKINCYTVE